MTHSPGPQSQQRLKRLVRGESPRPTPIPKLCPEVGRPVVYKLLLFRQPLGFCSLHFPEFVFGSGWRGEPGGLAFRLLDLCGQQGWVCWALVVFCGGTDPAGAREAQGLEELGFGPASSTYQNHRAWNASLTENRELAPKPRRELAALWEWFVGGSPTSPGSAGLRHFPD